MINLLVSFIKHKKLIACFKHIKKKQTKKKYVKLKLIIMVKNQKWYSIGILEFFLPRLNKKKMC